MELAELREQRVEQDIETLRSTQNAVLDRFDRFAETHREVRDIVYDNRDRLGRLESRMDRLEVRMDRFELRLEALELRLQALEARMERIEQGVAENRAMIIENRDAIRENRAILVSIADHFGLNYPKPGSDS